MSRKRKSLAALAAGVTAVLTAGLLLAAPAGAAPTPTAVFTQESPRG